MLRRAVLIALALVLSSAGLASAHTNGRQVLFRFAYEPFHGGLFFGEGITSCLDGAYPEACETSSRVVKVTAQARRWDFETGSWGRSRNVTSERSFWCEVENNHCKSARTTGLVSHDCKVAGGLIQYRTRVKAGYKLYDQAWLWTKYRYSSWVYGDECN